MAFRSPCWRNLNESTTCSTRHMCMSERKPVINQRVTLAAPRLMTRHSNCCPSRRGYWSAARNEGPNLAFALVLPNQVLILFLQTHLTADHVEKQCTVSWLFKPFCYLGSSHIINGSEQHCEMVATCYSVWQRGKRGDINPGGWQA